MGKIQVAVDLFLSTDPVQAEKLAKELCQMNTQRQAIEQEIYRQAISMLPTDQTPKAIVLAEESWHQGVVGIVASRIAEEFCCPTVLICLDGGAWQGQLPQLRRLQPVRLPDGVGSAAGKLRRPRIGGRLHHSKGKYPEIPAGTLPSGGRLLPGRHPADHLAGRLRRGAGIADHPEYRCPCRSWNPAATAAPSRC